MTRVAVYARYSTDKQRATSIDDQLSLCRDWASRQKDWTIVATYPDPAISGASLLSRPKMIALLRDAKAGRFDVVLAEGLDRLSRDFEDTAALHKRLEFLSIRLVTVAEGEVSPMHVGFTGTKNAMQIADVRRQVRRTMHGQVARGRSAGGRCYGYRVDRSRFFTNKWGELEPERGLLVIHPGEAAVVQRIFHMFAAGISPKAIAKTLNAEGVPGPRAAWSPSTIHGHSARATGVLNNSLYIGRRVWNRQQYRKDPDTDKRVSRVNNSQEWTTNAVPELRIIDDALWEQVKARQAATRLKLRDGIVRARRPIYLFSGLTKCGVCGGGYNVSSRDTLRCFNHVSRGTCANTRTISRQELEGRALRALKERFFAPGKRFDEFCRVFTSEVNRLRMEQRSGLKQARRELAGVDRDIQKVIAAIKGGFSLAELKVEHDDLQARKEALIQQLAAADAPLPLLHSQMAEVLRKKTMQLAAALEHKDDAQREAAREAIRALIERIVIPAGDGLLQVIGNLGAMLSAAGAPDAAGVAYVGCGGGI